EISGQAGAAFGSQGPAGGSRRHLPHLAARKHAWIHTDGALFPMTETTLTVSSLNSTDACYRHVILAGEPWIHEIRKGQVLRVVDLEGNQAVDTLFYNAHDYADRYSAQDTIRAQSSIYLTTGSQLKSSFGNTLMTIVADTCGRHDTLGGACATESNMVR